MTSINRRAFHLAAAIGLAIVTLAGIAAAGMTVVMSQGASVIPKTPSRGWPTAHAYNPDGPIVVAVVLGASQTVASDVLAPYEVFARSSQFSVYTVAASRAPAPLEGAPALLPAYTFAQVRSGIAPSPDVVVVPAVDDPAGAKETALRTFIIDQSDRGARILGVCSGSMVLAETGLLDGRRATSHWSRISALEKSRPAVHWVRGERYVQDGFITTTAGVTSGIPGALRVMADLAGADEAERVGRSLNYPGWTLDGSAGIPNRAFSLADAPVGLNAVMPWLRPTVAVGLNDGDNEIAVAGLFEVYNVSFAARAIAMSTKDTITTRHGLVLLTTPLGSGPAIDRIVVPGAHRMAEINGPMLEWAARNSVPIDAVNRPHGGNGFDAALEYLARDTDRATADGAAKMIDYPTDQIELATDGTSWRAPILLTVSVLIAIGVGLIPSAARIAVRRKRRTPRGA